MKKVLPVIFLLLAAITLILTMPGPDYCPVKNIPEDVVKLIYIQKLNDRVIIVHFGADAVTAFNTQKGIVVIDAGISNSLTAEFRKIIESEFADSKIAFLINTHSHADHTGGNQVFSGVPIIGHENCYHEITQNTGEPGRVKKNLLRIADGYDTRLREFEPGSSDWDEIFTQKMRYKLTYEDFCSNRTVTYPTITFRDRFSINSGDLTFDMIFFGKAHSSSDIMIHIPELKILMTGDLFYYGSSPSFGQFEKEDIQRWIVAKEWYTSRLDRIETLIGGHGQIMQKKELYDLTNFIYKKLTETI